MPPDKNIRNIPLLIIVFLFAGCYQDNEESLAPCVQGTVTHTQVQQVLLSYGCIGCHNSSGASGGVNLQQYSTLKVAVDRGRLVGAITHAAGFAPMPQGGTKMNDCDIARIQAWIAAGAKE